MDKLQKLKQDLEVLKAEHTRTQNSISEILDNTKKLQFPKAEQLTDKIKIKLYAHYILVKEAMINVQSQIIAEQSQIIAELEK